MALLYSSRSFYRAVILTLLQLSGLSKGLQVTPGSQCASYCLDDPSDDPRSPAASSTNSSDVVCLNEEYWSTTKGSKFKTCINCLQSSTAVNGTENDAAWFLYNLRYTVDVCLFAFPHADEEKTAASSPCVLSDTCQPLRTALETGNLTPNNGSEYDYCSADDGAFGGTALDSCIECFRTVDNQSYISNFLTALSAGCEQKPTAGTLLSLSGTLFTSSAVSDTGSSTNQTAMGASSSSSSPSLSTGTIVGIAVGATLLLLSGILLFYLLWRRQRAQEEYYFPDSTYSRGNRPIKSISSSLTGGYIPRYTVDYKRPPGTDHQRQYEMFDTIKAQHVVVPPRNVYDRDFPETATAGLWGSDTPVHTQHFIPSSQVRTPLAHQVSFDDTTLKGLDEMPTHPAFIPRVFTRGSRNPSAFVEEKRAPKSNKPDEFAVHQYLEMAGDMSTVNVQSLISPPLPTATTTKTMDTTKSSLLSNNPYANAQAQGSPMSVSPPSPEQPPSGSNAPVLTPNIALPSFSRLRSPKRYIPPPLNIEQAKPKAQRLSNPQAESDMP